MSFDEKLAKLVVQYSVDVQPNEVVLISGDVRVKELIYDIYVEVLKRQAFPVVYSGLADLDENGKIRGFVEKPTLEKPVSVGINVLKGKTLEEMELLRSEKQEVDLMGDVMPHLIKTGKPVYGYVSEAFWYDVLSTEAYEKLSPKLVDREFKEIIR